jgi:hypothetical protein
VEAGGSVETTLVLAANVSPVSLVAVAVTTGSWLFSGTVVAVLAIHAVFRRSHPKHTARHSFVDWVTAGPAWFKVSAFVLAAVTWKLMFLPILLLCVVAVYLPDPAREWGRGRRWLRRTIPIIAAAAGFALLWPTLQAAYAAGLWLPYVVLVTPLIGLVLGATGPILPRVVPPTRHATRILLAVLLLLALRPVLTTPVLPFMVVVTSEAGGELVPRRGHVIAVDDTSTTVLLETGGVEYIPSDQVADRILCADERDIPTYRLWIHGVHIEDSALEALGRRQRPTPPFDPWCHAG